MLRARGTAGRVPADAGIDDPRYDFTSHSMRHALATAEQVSSASSFAGSSASNRARAEARRPVGDVLRHHAEAAAIEQQKTVAARHASHPARALAPVLAIHSAAARPLASSQCRAPQGARHHKWLGALRTSPKERRFFSNAGLVGDDLSLTSAMVRTSREITCQFSPDLPLNSRGGEGGSR
jgi:hypothetical protein